MRVDYVGTGCSYHTYERAERLYVARWANITADIPRQKGCVWRKLTFVVMRQLGSDPMQNSETEVVLQEGAYA